MESFHPEIQRTLERNRVQKSLLTFAAGLHPRLGLNSYLRPLSSGSTDALNILKTIARFMRS
jgi:hypothetical protein